MSQVLFITRGVPASGKSTFAMKWVSEDKHNRARVNRDDIRFANFGSYVLSPDLEMVVSKIEEATITALLRAGKSVIIDNMNLKAKYIKGYLMLARQFNVPVMHKDFPIELKEALARNAVRDRKVDEDFLKKIYANFVRKGSFPPFPELEENPFGEPYAPDETKPKAYIVDIDGTIAHLGGGRSPYDYDRVLEDTPNHRVVELVRTLKAAGYAILVTSGRDSICRSDTLLWLEAEDVPFDDLFMRTQDDRRKDSIVKRELFDANIRHNYNVRGVLDDRDSVVLLWRSLGLFCAQVYYGDF
jgi:predicted kinase